jgi:fructose-1,6-bisphosphatase/inositol monophosphatase family enzyme
MSFIIGSQRAGVVNNVGRDQTIHGGQHGELVLDVERGRTLLAELRRQVAAASLPDGDRTAVLGDIDACVRAVHRDEPDARSLGSRLAAVAQVVVTAGAVVSAGTGIGAALAAIAAWLGPVGHSIRRMLPG